MKTLSERELNASGRSPRLGYIRELERAITLNRKSGHNNLADKLQKELDNERNKVAVRIGE